MIEELPPDYYVVNFRTVTRTVLDTAADLFDADEQRWMRAVLGLPEPALMLFARFVIRRGDVFRADRLVYPEIGDVRGPAEVLAGLGFLELRPALEVEERLSFLTLAELRPIAAELGVDARGNRPQLVERLRTHPALPERAVAAAELWRARRLQPFERARVVFFGNRHQSWTTFVLAGLERSRYPSYPVDREVRLFESRADLEAYLAAGARLDRALADPDELLRAGDEAAEALLARPSVAPHRRWADPAAEDEELVFEAARARERAGELTRAEALYRVLLTSRRVPRRTARAADRLGLLLHRQGRSGELDPEPALTAELDEVSRMQVRVRLARMGRGPDPRRALRRPLVRELELAPVGHRGPKALYARRDGEPATIEEATLEALGGDGVHAEGAVFTSLFALLCWDQLFAPVPGMLRQPYQDAPVDFESALFLKHRAEAFRARFDELRVVDLGAEVLRRHAAYGGLRCRGLSPRLDAELLARAAASLGGARLVPILDRLARHPRRHRPGLPDLLVFGEGHCRLVEVKGPGDAPSLEQLLWHDFLLRHDVPVEIVRVSPPRGG